MFSQMLVAQIAQVNGSNGEMSLVQYLLFWLDLAQGQRRFALNNGHTHPLQQLIARFFAVYSPHAPLFFFVIVRQRTLLRGFNIRNNF